MKNHDITISKTDKGYVAAATSSPFFCFAADTEDAALARVRQALDFYNGLEQKKVELEPRQRFELTPLTPSRTVSMKELVAA